MNIKILFSLVFVSIIPLSICAQSTYQHSNYATSGDSVHVSRLKAGLSSFNFDTTGANFTWNYSNLSLASQAAIKHIAPFEGGYRNSWCAKNSIVIGCNTQFSNLTNVAKQGLDSIVTGGVTFKNIVHHYEINTNTLSYKLFGATIQKGELPITLAISYTNPDSIYQFPLIYQNTDSNTFAYQMDLNEYGIELRNVVIGKRTNEVEGWGTLVTPFATYTNVLKVKTWVYKTDSLTTAQGTSEKTDTLLYYSWFDPSVSVPVLTVEGKITGGVKVFTEAQYQDSLRCVTPTAFFTYSPLVPYYDTTSYSCSINFGNLSGSAQNYTWDFGDGASSNAVNPSHTFKCPGSQIVKLYATNTVCSPSQSDTLTLPIYVIDSSNHFQKNSGLQICEGDSVLILGSYKDSSGVYSQTYTGHNGCDSTITVTLNVISHNKNVSKVLGNLTSNQTGASYQWVDCDAGNNPISDETGISFSPGASGNYAVLISKDGCIAQSECVSVVVTGIEDFDGVVNRIYPNPTTGSAHIDLNKNGKYAVQIFDLTGRIVKQFNIQNSTNALDFSELKAGEYLLVIQSETDDSVARIRFIKQ